MANYGYQYDTSPRKLEPEENPPKKLPKKANKTKKSNSKDKAKKQEVKIAKRNFAMVMVVVLSCILLLMYRNVKIREYYAGVQELNKEISSLQKENGQIAVQIQNNLNLNNIESIATSTLGMQKLSSKQTVYVNLDTKDYTEVSQKSITKEKKNNVFRTILDKIIDFF